MLLLLADDTDGRLTGAAADPERGERALLLFVDDGARPGLDDKVSVHRQCNMGKEQVGDMRDTRVPCLVGDPRSQQHNHPVWYVNPYRRMRSSWTCYGLLLVLPQKTGSNCDVLAGRISFLGAF